MNRIVSFADRAQKPVLLCFAHLRWDFVFQRPQHLMTRAASSYQVAYIEEPETAPGPAHFRLRLAETGVAVLTPIIPPDSDPAAEQRKLIASYVAHLGERRFVHWYYTPQAMAFTQGLRRDLCVYDCMDELSSFRFAPADQLARERALLGKADLVFTGGASLYAAKRDLHPVVRLFPSSVDTAHFGAARRGPADPADQAAIPRPRVGFFGVIDERMDLQLVGQMARRMPDVQFVMLGPVVKIDPADLPQAANLHWLGCKSYADLPAYLGNWDVGWMPFALNDATRFISPTKTPEFLAAGLPVVSTAITDVVEGYGKPGLVTIADADTTEAALRQALGTPSPAWRRRVDGALAAMSWDATWDAMRSEMQARMRQPVEV